MEEVGDVLENMGRKVEDFVVEVLKIVDLQEC